MSAKQIALWWATVWLGSSITLACAADAPLADAAEIMDQERMLTLLEESADLNRSQVDGMTALHWVTRHDNLKTARLLVRSGANVNAANRYGVTPLTLACTNGNSALVELLLGAGANPNTTLPGGETALMTASRTGRVGPVKALLAHGANPHAVVRGMGRQDVVGVGYFLIRMADPTTFNFEIKAEQTALMWAAAEGHAAVVKELIKAGAEFQTALSSGFTPLLFAVREGHSEVVRTLVEAGADINESINPLPDWRHITNDAPLRPGARPLHVAVENGQFELAAYLLEAGAEANMGDLTGYTALHAMVAARKVPLGDANPPPEPSGNMTSLELVNKLALHGADLDAAIRKAPPDTTLATCCRTIHVTPFLMASQTTDTEFMEVLASLGANPQLPNEDGSTALMLVGEKIGTAKKVLEAMQILLDLGVDIDAVNHNDETAMHFAAYKNRPSIIKFLAHKGANIDIWNRKNKYGSTPLAIAVGHRGSRSFKPQPKTEAAIREVMIAAGVHPPEKITTETHQSH